MKMTWMRVGLLVWMVSAALALAGGIKWELTTKLEQVKIESKAKGKPILLLFTGSDWCPYCVKLEKQVFDTKEFKAYAKDNLLLVIADFPRGKKVPKAVQEANLALKTTYGVSGYPKVVVLDSEGTEIGRFGYRSDVTGESIVAMLKEVAAKLTPTAAANVPLEKGRRP